MATDLNYIKYVVEQIDLPDISFKKMFGEYMVYYKAVPVLLVCDDCVFVKILNVSQPLRRRVICIAAVFCALPPESVRIFPLSAVADRRNMLY